MIRASKYSLAPATRGEAYLKKRSATMPGLKLATMRNVVALVRPFDDPVPPDVRDLDLITFLFFYHDTTYMDVDRTAMNRKLQAVLKPGGILVIADHSARAGEGVSVGKTL